MNKEKRNNLRFDSKAAYIPPDEATNAVTPPIVMASSFKYDSDIFQRIVDGARKDVNIYGRCGNPSEYQFEDQMVVIEGADACLATASGMAAVLFLIPNSLRKSRNV